MAQARFVRLKPLILLVLLLVASALSSAEKITLVADDWCPYNCEPESESPGYVIELLEEIFKRHDITIEYQYLSWSDSLEGVLAGKYNGAIGATPTELPKGIFPSEEIGLSGDVFVVRNDRDWYYQGVESLSRITLGATQDYDYGDAINNYFSTASSDKFRLLNSNIASELNLSKLFRGSIDAYIGDRNVIFYKANMLGLSKEFKVVGQAWQPEPVYIVLSPKIKRSYEYAHMLSQGMHDLRKSGRLKTIMNKYGLKDWK